MVTLDDIRSITIHLPGSEERATTGGAAWFVRNKLFAWECHPWPSMPEEIRELCAAELVVGVKVADRVDALALVEMEPDVFLRTTTPWGEPKIAFRMAGIDQDHLAELVTEAWRVQAPKYLRREFDGVDIGGVPTRRLGTRKRTKSAPTPERRRAASVTSGPSAPASTTGRPRAARRRASR